MEEVFEAMWIKKTKFALNMAHPSATDLIEFGNSDLNSANESLTTKNETSNEANSNKLQSGKASFLDNFSQDSKLSTKNNLRNGKF